MELLFALVLLPIASFTCLLSKRRGAIESTTMVAAFVAVAASVSVAWKVAGSGSYSPFPAVAIDPLGALVLCTVSVVGLATLAYSIPYLRGEVAKGIIGFPRVKLYFTLLNLFEAAMMFATIASNPVIAWISIEATTLSTALLISFYDKPSSVDAAWKYLIINSIGLLLGFFGTLLYFTPFKASVPGDGLVSWEMLLSNATHMDPAVAKIAFVFVLVGYGTKIGFVPMHAWKPDVYGKAPSPLGAMFSGALLPVAFSILLRCKSVTDTAIGNAFSNHLFVIFGVLSVVLAALLVYSQRNYKRLLAYSSIEHAGLMALGFGFGGIGPFSAILHMLYHSILKSALFLVSGNILLRYSTTKIAKVRGIIASLPVTSVLYLIGFFAITGMPPFGLFLTKIQILSSGMKSNMVPTALVMLSMAMLFVGFFKHATSMAFGEKPSEIKSGEGNIWLLIPPLLLILLAFYLSISLPSFLNTLIVAAALGR